MRHYSTIRKIADSIPDEVTGFFNWHVTSKRTMALGSTQPLTEMSTRNLPGNVCKGWAINRAPLCDLQWSIVLLFLERSIYLWLYSPLLDLGHFFSFLIYTVSRTSWTRDQPVVRPLHTRKKKRTQTFMPWVGFEPTIPALKRANMVHALDRAASVIGKSLTTVPKICFVNSFY
jgi:hypothetical protein